MDLAKADEERKRRTKNEILFFIGFKLYNNNFMEKRKIRSPFAKGHWFNKEALDKTRNVILSDPTYLAYARRYHSREIIKLNRDIQRRIKASQYFALESERIKGCYEKRRKKVLIARMLTVLKQLKEKREC